jgi:two-component sensor histidine kinase
MKYAFKKRNIGIVNIELTKNETKNLLYYSDNGDGFDFEKINEKGLGLEIIKGLIDQIDGTVETKTENGFELLIYFN